MRDYAELVKALRTCKMSIPCTECPFYSNGDEPSKECATMNVSAADAIEELLFERDQYKAYFDNVSSLPDCNVCLKQSVCEFVPAWGENTRINCPLALTEPPKEEG